MPLLLSGCESDDERRARAEAVVSTQADTIAIDSMSRVIVAKANMCLIIGITPAASVVSAQADLTKVCRVYCSQERRRRDPFGSGPAQGAAAKPRAPRRCRQIVESESESEVR